MIADTVESWTERWKERMRGFAISIIKLGFTGFLEAFHEAIKPMIKPFVKDLQDAGGIPDDLKAIFDDLVNGKQSPAAILGMSMAQGAGSGLTGAFLEPLFKYLNQVMYKKIRSSIPAEVQLILAAWRGLVNWEYVKDKLQRSGYEDEWIDILQDIIQGRLPEDRLRDLYLRGEIDESKVRTELVEQGWTDDRITELMKLWYVLPTPQDLVAFMAHEVFEEGMVKRYGLDDEFEKIDLTLMKKVGLSPELARQYWRNHWQHASWTQVTEMLHRGLITQEDVYDWFRLIEIPPYWREKLIGVSWNIPTRVDVRRFWDMGTIDENRLREVYTGMGYHGKDLDDYVLWTKVYVAFPDLVARYKNGWIGLDDCRSELKALGMTDERAEQLIQTKVKPMAEERTAPERSLTKAEIVKGIKKGVISVAEGLGLLIEMGYSEEESAFIVSINIDLEESIPEIIAKRDLAKTDILNAIKGEVISLTDGRIMLINLGYDAGETDILILTKLGLTSLTELDALQIGGSPTSYSGYKTLVGKFKQAKGTPTILPSPELVRTERELKAAKDALTHARITDSSPAYLAPYLQRITELEQRYLELLRAQQQTP